MLLTDFMTRASWGEQEEKEKSLLRLGININRTENEQARAILS